MSARDATHYQGKVEVIDAIEAWGLKENAYLAHVVRYVARAGKKTPDGLPAPRVDGGVARAAGLRVALQGSPVPPASRACGIPPNR